ncbi:GMP synthase (glutamine-hydrolyzing), partial [Candidatus Acetothermia bacterium]
MSVAILDFGSQYTQLIARRIRELRAYSVILPGTSTVKEIEDHQPKAIILSGGPASVFDPAGPRPDPRIFELDVPLLGICYGMHYLVYHFGGQVERADQREYGRAHLV